MRVVEAIELVWALLPTIASIVLSAIATVHVLLHKEHARAAVGWVGLVWLAPVIGPALYTVFGINRIQRKAHRLRGVSPRLQIPMTHPPERLPPEGELRDLAEAVGRVARQPLTDGNRIVLLRNGDEAYPAMLEAIRGAQSSISLCTYIFDIRTWGRRFVEALAEAQERGVEVKVLIDGLGSLYGWPNPLFVLRRAGIDARAFLLSLAPWRMAYLNLRNHRKILVVDGRIGFTGGINIRDHHVLADAPSQPTADLHFQVEGPVVRQLQRVFAVDWAFTTGHRLEGEGWYPPLEPAGTTLARAVPDGPDEDFEAAQWAFIAALACARRSVRILTPYFLPDEELIGVLNATALRGVEVDVVLPEKNNLGYLTWATACELPRIMSWGVRVWSAPGPFDHAKLAVVDRTWVLFGSANVDPRSLRLNFELVVEAYDHDLGERCEQLCLERIGRSRRITLEDLDARPLPVKVRDGIARLFKPYL